MKVLFGCLSTLSDTLFQSIFYPLLLSGCVRMGTLFILFKKTPVVICLQLFCCACDYDPYLSERGTYCDIDDHFTNKSCMTEDELLSLIKKIDYMIECENTRRLRDDFIKYGIGATEECVNI